MKNIIVNPGEEIALGKRGENLARCAVFDISDWVTTYGEGTVHLLHQRNGDKIPYPCVVEMENGLVCWVITNTETEIAGRGLVELQYWVGDTIAKSATYNTRVGKSMGVAGDVPPEPAENWLETMLELSTETKEAAQAVEEVVSTVEDLANDIKTSGEAIQDSAAIVAEQLETVQEQVAAAETAAGDAEAAQKAAEQARDEAQAIAGGDFATKPELESHTTDKDNPHGVTAAQVRAMEAIGEYRGDLDTSTATAFIVQTNSTVNAELFAALGSTSSFAHVIQGAFYSSVSNTTARMQIAVGRAGNMASRAYNNTTATWSPWTKCATTADVVSKAGDTMTGGFKIRMNTPTLTLIDSNNGREGRVYHNAETLYVMNDADTSHYAALMLGKETASMEKLLRVQTKTDSATNTYTILHSGNVSDYAIGKAGGIMTGTLDFNPGNHEKRRAQISKSVNSGTGEDYGTILVDRDANGDSVQMLLRASDRRLAFQTIVGGSYSTRFTVFHTGNVTAGTADITAGSAPLATDNYYDVYE